MKVEEKLMRAAGYDERAKELRKKWRKATADYKFYSLRNHRSYQEYRCMVDEVEINASENTLQKPKDSGIINIQGSTEVASGNTPEETTKDLWQNDLPPRGQVELPKGVTRIQFIQQELGVTKEKAQAYDIALGEFTCVSYSDIRAYQCGKKVGDEEKIKKLADDLEEYIQKAPRWNGGETYRGIGLSENDLSVYRVGYEFTMRGMASWSNDIETAYEFAYKHKSIGKAVVFHCEKQSKGTAIAHLSLYEEESEVLVSNAARYKVCKIEENSDYVHIYVEEV